MSGMPASSSRLATGPADAGQLRTRLRQLVYAPQHGRQSVTVAVLALAGLMVIGLPAVWIPLSPALEAAYGPTPLTRRPAECSSRPRSRSGSWPPARLLTAMVVARSCWSGWPAGRRHRGGRGQSDLVGVPGRSGGPGGRCRHVRAGCLDLGVGGVASTASRPGLGGGHHCLPSIGDHWPDLRPSGWGSHRLAVGIPAACPLLCAGDGRSRAASV
jgi:hypothetical protein